MTFVIDRLRHGQTLHEIWAKSDNLWQSYCSLNRPIWPYDREHVSRVALCSGIVCMKLKLSLAIRSWNVTIFDANTSCHAMTLTFDPLTLNFCGRSGIMWSIYLPNFSDIDQSAAELLSYWWLTTDFSSIFRACSNTAIGIFLNAWTDLRQIWWEHCQVIATHRV